jgi:Flp pilus assembly protein TadD
VSSEPQDGGPKASRSSSNVPEDQSRSAQNTQKTTGEPPVSASPAPAPQPAQPHVTWTPIGGTPAAAPSPSRSPDARNRARAEVAEAVGLYNRQFYQPALQRLISAVRLDPTNAEYHNMLGCTAERAGRAELVEPHLTEALRLQPRHVGAHTALAAWFSERGSVSSALEHSATAIELAPTDPKVILARAGALFAAGDKPAALQTLRPLLDQPVPVRWAAQLYARLAPDVGHEEQALAVLDRALTATTLPPTPDGKPLLLFAAAALLERMKRYDEAFERVRQANDVARASRPPFDPPAHATRVSGLIRYFSKRRMRSLPRADHGNTRPVFIIGMPRSGTSLVEQILATHPEVFGAGELPALSIIALETSSAAWAQGEPYPNSLDMLSTRRADELAARYLSVIEPMNLAARYVTDKMPTNFLHLGLIELMFPDSRIIHCVRNPLDTCLSCYTSNFANGNEFAFELSHLGPYYREYGRMMDHWRQVLTLPMLEVRYEDVVLDTEGQVRRMLEFLGLPWDPRCLKFHENPRPVQTSSKDQVTRPIYVSSIGRWKFYERHLGELIASLSTPAGSQRRAG